MRRALLTGKNGNVRQLRECFKGVLGEFRRVEPVSPFLTYISVDAMSYSVLGKGVNGEFRRVEPVSPFFPMTLFDAVS